MKILVTGGNGMLGTDLVSILKNSGHQVLAPTKQELDITDRDVVLQQVPQLDLIINCAAYAMVDLAETEKEQCYNINVVGVRNLVELCKFRGIALVQISTDYVFDGKKSAYNEYDSKNPLNYYGKTKAEAENIVLNELERAHIIRTEWMFGKNGKNFVDTIRSLALQRKELRVINDQIGSPTYTKDLCQGILEILNKNYDIYHITNSGACSWYALAQMTAQLCELDCMINPCTTAEYPLPAKRPRFSVLNNNKTRILRTWQEALTDYLKNEN